MMSTLFTGRSVWLYQKPVDFRKQINGLIGVVESEMAGRVEDGSIYVFLNRSRQQAKLLLWDHNGYFMGVKRLDHGRFDEPMDTDDGCGLQLSTEQLFLLLTGVRFMNVMQITPSHRS